MQVSSGNAVPPITFSHLMQPSPKLRQTFHPGYPKATLPVAPWLLATVALGLPRQSQESLFCSSSDLIGRRIERRLTPQSSRSRTRLHDQNGKSAYTTLSLDGNRPR